MPKKLTQEEFLRKVKVQNKNDIDCSRFVYQGNSVKGICKCNVCGHVWATIPMTLFKGHGCPVCGVKKNARKRRLTQEEVVWRIQKIYGDRYSTEKINYVNARTKVEVVCKKHGPFMAVPHDLFRHHGCPICRESSLESMLRKSLRENNIEFESQFSFDWMRTCLYGKLSYDFFIPQYNIAIECQGRQHFETVLAFGGEKEHEKVLKRDIKKKELSNENNVQLVYFLEKKYNKYMKDEDIYFNNVEELIKYVKSFG
jgi:hypothetical protein